jgi:hypothetical protein
MLAIATVILAGMMFIPIINLVVGIVVGSGLFGVAGGFAGAAFAVLITIAAFNPGVGKLAERGSWRRRSKVSFFTGARNEEARGFA